MRVFATALLVVSTIAAELRQADPSDDIDLACLADVDGSGVPNAAHCLELEDVRLDFEGKFEQLRFDFDNHAGDTTIHSSTSSVDLPGDSASSSTDDSSSDSDFNPWRHYSFDSSSDSSHHHSLSSYSLDHTFSFLHNSHSHSTSKISHYRPRRSYKPKRRTHRHTVYQRPQTYHAPQPTYSPPAPTYKKFPFKYGFQAPASTSHATTSHTHAGYSETDLVGYIAFLESKVKQANATVN